MSDLMKRSLHLAGQLKQAAKAIEDLCRVLEIAGRRLPLPESYLPPLDLTVEEMCFSVRARKSLQKLGCVYLGDVIKLSADDLYGVKNCGVSAVQEIRDRLAEHKLRLSCE